MALKFNDFYSQNVTLNKNYATCGLIIYTKHIAGIDSIVVHNEIVTRRNQHKFPDIIKIPNIMLQILKPIDTNTYILPIYFSQIRTIDVNFNAHKQTVEYEPILKYLGMSHYAKMLYRFIPVNNEALIYDARLQLEKTKICNVEHYVADTYDKKIIEVELMYNTIYKPKIVLAFVCCEQNKTYDQIVSIENEDGYMSREDLIYQRFKFRDYFVPYVYMFSVNTKTQVVRIDEEEQIDKSFIIKLLPIPVKRKLHFFVFSTPDTPDLQ